MAAGGRIEPAHSHLGPSSSDRWINCPGSVLASLGVEEEDSVWAREGSCAHQVAEEARDANRPASDWLGKEYFGIKVDKEMVTAVQEFIDYVEGLPGDKYNEHRVRYQAYVKDGFGTMDAAAVQPQVAHIVDLKYGEGVQVFPNGNTQLMLYALGFWLEYWWLYRIEGFVLTIFQPRLQHVESWFISLNDLLEWADTVARPAGIRAMQKDQPRRAGEWCKFCKLRKNCSTKAGMRAIKVEEELDCLDGPGNTTELDVTTEDWDI